MLEIVPQGFRNRETSLTDKRSKIIRSIEENRVYHTRYLRAISSPLRREILRFLQEGCSTIDHLQSKTGQSQATLKWHLDILERGFCVETQIKEGELIYQVTQEDKVVDYL